MAGDGVTTTKGTIQVPVEMWEEWERIFHSGARGTHLLFTNDMIRRAFAQALAGESLNDEKLVARIQQALAVLMDAETLFDQQQFVESLDDSTRAALVQLYFGLLDRYLAGDDSQPEVLH
ncbi:MAG: hypothetical protein DRI34_02485 [Deltaproteobacteria bacterium]|nr:MAG: hypothetical protein DRI34_02485 [Deltaproteobacteria bacterium]